MLHDLNDFISIQLEVSSDSVNFKKYKEIKRGDLSASIYIDSMMGFLRELIDEGKLICQEQNYQKFRLRICTEKENFFLYDASLRRVENKPLEISQIPEQEKQRYTMLTKREKQILCFLYRGYRQNDMAFIFGTTVHTIKKHRYNIYEKAGFRNQSELSAWCEKYLLGVFKRPL